jgi:D-sedoheptulose 7-phosphate isomerase
MLLSELLERYPCLSVCKNDIEKAAELLYSVASKGGKILVCGNGGSSADSDHIVGELMKGFLKKRRMSDLDREKFRAALGDEAQFFTENLQGAIPAVSLSAQTAISSAFINDVEPSLVYAQMVYGLGKAGDLLIGISTSGNSENVVNALLCAKAMGLSTIALTGEKESKLSKSAEVTVKVPERETFKVQELHLPIYHYLCASLEDKMFES